LKIFLKKLKPYRLILRLGGIKEVIRMSDEAIRELFRIFVEEGELDEEQAERILQRILDILFGDRAESEEADE
jgi:polyhydroxyalkanoate synthesis regulator phasin